MGPAHLMPKVFVKPGYDVALPRLIDDARAGQFGHHRRHHVFGHRHVRHDAFDLAVFGSKADPGGNRVGGLAWGKGRAVKHHAACDRL